MSLSIKQEDVNGHLYLSLEGRLDSAGSAQLKKILEVEIVKAEKHIVLNMADVTFVSSAGVGVTVKSLSALKQKQLEIRFVATPTDIKKIYDMLGFTNAIKFFDTKDQACD